MDNPLLYIASVYEAFDDEPGKFEEFLKLAGDATTAACNKNDKATAIVSMDQLMKGHENLLQGLGVFFPNAHRVSHATTFLDNVKKGFVDVQARCERSVYDSVLSALVKHKNRKTSLEKMQQEKNECLVMGMGWGLNLCNHLKKRSKGDDLILLVLGRALNSGRTTTRSLSPASH
ncbi:unnamed protein product [Microthlaspi erraticum]|uniref:Uncharacterized protein n=1 Tax=Microthlaspi erraticum TaxID=1685480 RepID=A0A6D2JCC9_9BRAS|nr:unnamed protein product [Microthlaspi erraticum]